MRSHQIRTTLAVLTAAMLSVSLTGCSGAQGSTGIRPGTGSTLEVELNHSYASEQVAFEGMPHISEIIALNDRVLIRSHDGEQNREFYYLMDESFQSAEPVNFTAFEESYALQQESEEDDYTSIAAIFTDSEGMTKLICQSYTLDAAGVQQNCSYTLETYDGSMQLTDSQDITAAIGEKISISDAAEDTAGNLYLLGANPEAMECRYVVLDADCQPLHSGSLWDALHARHIFCGSDGSIYISYFGVSGLQEIGRLDPADGTLERIRIEGMPTMLQTMYHGGGNYDYFVQDETALYGIRMDEAVCEEVVNWLNSDFLGADVRTAVPLADGTFLISAYDITHMYTELWYLRPRTPEEMDAVQLISLAALDIQDDVLRYAVQRFNREHAPCRIAIREYAQDAVDNASWDAGVSAFEDDMTSGIVADIICLDQMSFERYVNKGLFADLYTCMEADADFREEDYFMNYFSSMAYGEHLYRMGYGFTIRTLAAKTEHAGEEMGITPQEMMERMATLPDGMRPFADIGKETALTEIVLNNLGSFVDEQAGTCSFDTPEFIGLLEFCGSCGEETMSWSENEWRALENAYRADRVLYRHTKFSEPGEYHTLTAGIFGGEPVTLVGYPTVQEEANGGVFDSWSTLAMSSQTAYPEQVWSFLKLLLSEDFQSSLLNCLPVHRGAMAGRMEQAMTPVQYEDADGILHDMPNYYTNGTGAVEIGYATAAEMETLTAYVEGIRDHVFTDAAIYGIVYEEAVMYFSGDSTAEQAAEKIQGRVSLYLSERG